VSIEIVAGEDAYRNVAGQPANVMLYGPPGTLKTTDAVAAFSRPFVIPCEDNGLKIIAARGLPVPAHVKTTVKTWMQMAETIAWLYQHRQHFSALILDGFSAFCGYIYKEAEDQHRDKKNKFAVPTQVRAQLFSLREWIRQIGLHSVLIAHPLPPVVQDGVFYQGGFSMAPKTLIGDFFGQIDSVMRVDHISLPGQPPQRVYFTGGTAWPEGWGMAQPPDWRFWRTKNREGCASAIVPADLGAFLRARQPGYVGL